MRRAGATSDVGRAVRVYEIESSRACFARVPTCADAFHTLSQKDLSDNSIQMTWRLCRLARWLT